MDEMRTLTQNALQQTGFTPSEAMLDQLCTYAALLQQWNEKVNLTAITQPAEIAVKHFADSALLLRAAALPQGARVADIGTGAGFPGMVLKILRPDLQVTLIDSLNKRLVFLKEVCEKLDVPAQLLHMRAEGLPKASPLRGSFDLATARAVAKLPMLCKYCLPYVRKNGIFAAMKGPNVYQELSEGNVAAKKYGATEFTLQTFTLPDESERVIALTCRKEILPKENEKFSRKKSGK